MENAIVVSTTRSSTDPGIYARNYASFGSSQLMVLHTLTDDGAGGFVGGMGSVNYATQQVHLKVVNRGSTTADSYRADHEDAASFEAALADDPAGTQYKGGEWSSTTVTEGLLASPSLQARYRTAPAAPQARSMTYTPPGVVLDLSPYTSDRIVPNSVRFTWMDTVYEDFNGVIYRDRSASSNGIASGTIDYMSGLVAMTDYVVGAGGDPTSFSLQSLWTSKGQWRTAHVVFATQAAPLLAGPGGMSLMVLDVGGTLLTATPDSNGNITGTHLRGRVVPATGLVELQFGDYVLDASLSAADKAEWWYDPADIGAVEVDKIWRPWPVDPGTLKYNAVVLVYLPIDAELMGLDPTVFPPDGRVALATPGKLAVAGKSVTVPAFSPSNGMTVNLGQTRLSIIKVLGPDGALVSGGYTEDLDAGTITITDITGWPGTVSLWARQEVYHQIVEARVDGSVRLRTPLGIDLPAGALLSTALRQGDLFARAALLWTQGTWAGTNWKMTDITTGAPAAAMFDQVSYPVAVDNQGAITDLFALRFRSDGTTFDCYSRARGLIAQGNKNENFAPINPATGTPIFTLDYRGWGSGWVAGNTLFVPIYGPVSPVVLVMSVSPGAAPGGVYSLTLEQRGDVDNPPAGPY